MQNPQLAPQPETTASARRHGLKDRGGVASQKTVEMCGGSWARRTSRMEERATGAWEVESYGGAVDQAGRNCIHATRHGNRRLAEQGDK